MPDLGPTHRKAIRLAAKYAREGPCVAAVLWLPKSRQYIAVKGFVDADTPIAKQHALVTPDGRVWVLQPKHSDS